MKELNLLILVLALITTVIGRIAETDENKDICQLITAICLGAAIGLEFS